MIRVEISCNRCNAMLGAATDPNSIPRAINHAVDVARGKGERQNDGGIYCARCVVFCNWLMLPHDKRGPAPADPCARNDR